MDSIRFLLVTFFGSGLAPFASGTFGSAAAVLVAAGVHYLWGWNPWWLAAGAVVAGVINVACGAWIEKRWGKDPGEVVIDEVAGQWIALMAPIAGAKPLWGYTAAFFLFRIFDILKPLGARRLEALPRGWGVLLDDVLSGIYVALILWGAGTWLPL